MASFSKGKYSITKSVLFSMIIPHNVVENFYKEFKVEEKMIELFTKLKELNITYQINALPLDNPIRKKYDELLNSLKEDNTQFKAKKQKYYDTKDYYVQIFDALKADYNFSNTPIEEKMYYLSLLDIQEILGNNMYQFYMLNISMFNSYKAYMIEIKLLSQLILSSY